MKAQLAMVIDSSTCIDCKGCMAACKVENKVPDGYWRNWIKYRNADFKGTRWPQGITATHFQPGNCMHCSDPFCVQACPTSATYKDQKDGTVKVNEKLCIGCGSCIPACPYGARFRHPEKKIVDKCDFCERRRLRGDLPACVTTCPTKARVFGDLNDAGSNASRLLKQNKAIRVINPDSNTKPNVYYLNTTAPLNWPSKAKMSTPIDWWRRFANPLVWFVVGINALGVLLMLGRQILLPEGDGKEDNQTGGHDERVND